MRCPCGKQSLQTACAGAQVAISRKLLVGLTLRVSRLGIKVNTKLMPTYTCSAHGAPARCFAIMIWGEATIPCNRGVLDTRGTPALSMHVHRFAVSEKTDRQDSLRCVEHKPDPSNTTYSWRGCADRLHRMLAEDSMVLPVLKELWRSSALNVLFKGRFTGQCVECPARL